MRKPRKAKTDRRADRAEAVIDFIEQLIVPSGVGQGQKFRLREWERRWIRDIYEPHGTNDDGAYGRLVRRAILSMARKNGKTMLIGCLVLVHLIGPEWEENGEIYSAANDRDQAALVYKAAAQIVRGTPVLRQRLRCIDSTKTIACYENGSFYKALSSESGTKHGMNPTLVIYDELAQAKSRELYDVLDTSMGGRQEPLFVVISTQNNDPEHILSKLIDDGLNSGDPTIVCHLYEVPEGTKDIYDASVWRMANPALGDFRSLTDLKTLAEKAQRLPAEEPKFRNLYLNQRVSSAASLISRVEWTACAGDATLREGEDIYLALDMSAVLDLTALVAGSAGERTRVQPFIWKPADRLAEHSDRDFGKKAQRYVEWHRDGHLLATPGKAIDPAVIAAKIGELNSRFKIVGLAYDRWRMDMLQRELDRLQIENWKDEGGEKTGTGLRLVPWGQGYKDMAPAIDALELEITERRLVQPQNPVLTWAMGNAVSISDPAGNRKLDKDKVKFRIDPAVALTMLCGLKARDREKVTNVPLIV